MRSVRRLDPKPRERRRPPRLLHLDCSASRGAHSITRQLTALFARRWLRAHGAAGYRYRDLAADPVPLISAAYVSLGTRVERHGVVPLAEVAGYAETAAERREWELSLPLISELLEADTVLLGVPMYNFSVPASAKAWIDRITFPGAYRDLATGRKVLGDTRVVAVSARGAGYGKGSPREGFDHQEPYLRAYLTGQLGISQANLHFVHAELTRAGDIPRLAGFRDQAARSLAAARAEVLALADASVSHRVAG
jgi:FMN-dependent NADH-azoreductase